MGMWGLVLFSWDWSRERACDSFFWWDSGGFRLADFEGFFSWGAREFFFLFFSLSFVCGGLGVLDHGAGLQVCFFFSFTLCFTVGHTGLCTFHV